MEGHNGPDMSIPRGGEGVLNISIVPSSAKDRVSIDPTVVAKKPITITVGNGSTVTIGPGCKFYGSTVLYFKDNCVCEIGANCILIDTRIVCGSNAVVTIGEGTSINDHSALFCRSGHEIHIGKDCMFSQEVVLHAGDAHPIYDVRKGIQTNCFPPHTAETSIILQDHVWIGWGAMLMQKTQIGCGSIIGAKSVVKGFFPNNCIIAGVPARIKRKDAGWKEYAGCLTPEDYLQCTRENELDAE